MIVIHSPHIYYFNFYYANNLRQQLRPMQNYWKFPNKTWIFKPPGLQIKEFNQVLSGLDDMRAALRRSLMENWKAEQDKQKSDFCPDTWLKRHHWQLLVGMQTS